MEQKTPQDWVPCLSGAETQYPIFCFQKTLCFLFLIRGALWVCIYIDCPVTS